MQSNTQQPIPDKLGYGYSTVIGYYITLDGQRLKVGDWWDGDVLEEAGNLREEAIRAFADARNKGYRK